MVKTISERHARQDRHNYPEWERVKQNSKQLASCGLISNWNKFETAMEWNIQI